MELTSLAKYVNFVSKVKLTYFWGLKSRPDISHARLPFLTVNPLVYFQFSF